MFVNLKNYRNLTYVCFIVIVNCFLPKKDHTRLPFLQQILSEDKKCFVKRRSSSDKFINKILLGICYKNGYKHKSLTTLWFVWKYVCWNLFIDSIYWLWKYYIYPDEFILLKNKIEVDAKPMVATFNIMKYNTSFHFNSP